MYKQLSIALISGSLLTACLPETETPSHIAQQYWNALKAGDTETAKQYVSSGTQQSFQDYIALPSEQKIPVEEIHIGEQRVTVTTIIHPTGEARENYNSFETVLVLENGKWKVNAMNTQPPAPKTPAQKELDELAAQLSESAQKNIESIDEAMTQGMQRLNEALREGSNEMGNSLLKGMEELNQKMRESIDKMKQRRNKDPNTKQDDGEGMI